MRYALVVFLLFFSGYGYSPEITGCEVSFDTTANPGALSITGKGGTCAGMLIEKDGRFSGEFKSRISDYKTGIGLRDRHMQRFLGVEENPVMTLSFKDELDDGELAAYLTIKKDKKPVKIMYKKDGSKVLAKFSIEIKDYPSIGIPSHLGITAASSVDISVEFHR